MFSEVDERGCNSRHGLAQIGLGKGKPAIIPGNDSSGYSPGEDESLVPRTTGSLVCGLRCAIQHRAHEGAMELPWSTSRGRPGVGRRGTPPYRGRPRGRGRACESPMSQEGFLPLLFKLWGGGGNFPARPRESLPAWKCPEFAGQSIAKSCRISFGVRQLFGTFCRSEPCLGR